MEPVLYVPPTPGRLARWLWKSAGADAHILAQCPYGEHVKFACLGGIVLSTGVLAGLAAVYALQTIFVPSDPNVGWLKYDVTMAGSLVLGVLWGCVIFNLDRYIVASTGKGDGTERITWQEFLNALPRMVLGVIIAVTISKPLEIRIFKPEVDAYLYRMQQAELGRNRDAIEINYTPEFAKLDKEASDLRARIAGQARIVDSTRQESVRELDGTGGSGKAEAGPIYRAKKSIADQEQATLEKLEAELGPRLQAIEARRQGKESELQAELAQSRVAAAGLSGFLARMQAAHEIAGFAVSSAITLLFVAIELTPIFFKLMLVKGPYDYLEENAKQIVLARHGVERQHEFEEGPEGADLEKLRCHHPERMIHETKERLTLERDIVTSWSDRHRSNLPKELDRFVLAAPPPDGGASDDRT